MKQPTPKTLGYRMPAEWEPQEAVWLTWPHNVLTWPGALLGEVQVAYVEIIRALCPGQKIKLLVQNQAEAVDVRGRLAQAGVPPTQVKFFEVAAEDSWIRDYGPTFLVNRESGQHAFVKWIFNAWGNKYDDLIR